MPADKTRVKACAIVECQTFDGVLEVICIHGGAITQLEQREMPAILRDARADAAQSGVRCFFELRPMSFHDFEQRFERDDE